MKYMNQMEKGLMPMKLQFFAEGDGDDNSGNDEGDDNQGDDKDADKKSEKKLFSQEDLDKAITKRLERERKKAEKKQEDEKSKGDDKTSDTKDDQNKVKISALEEKVLCYDHDIKKEYSKEAIALAKAYVDEDTDMDEALELVIKKFPMFSKGFKSEEEDEEEETDNKSWGKRQKQQSQKTDSVEEAFKKRNPGLKID